MCITIYLFASILMNCVVNLYMAVEKSLYFAIVDDTKRAQN